MLANINLWYKQKSYKRKVNNKTMITKLKITLLTLVSLFMFAAPLAVPATVGAAPDIQSGLCGGANLDANDTSCDASTAGATDKINNIITVVINAFSLIVGIASVIMIIIGGLRYIISGGEAGNVTSAKNTILYAIIGLVVVALAQFIVKFVLAKVTQTP